jgi:hypothetical protein
VTNRDSDRARDPQTCRANGRRRQPEDRRRHVNDGDFNGAKRSDWDPENLLEREYDFALHWRMFEEADAA